MGAPKGTRYTVTPSRIAQWEAQFGCSHDFIKTMCDVTPWQDYVQRLKTPVCAYITQKRGAARRGIEWQFTLKTWWDFWQASRRWPERGAGKGKYVMARFNDAGPYSTDNCYIATHSQNLRDFREVSEQRQRWRALRDEAKAA